MPKLSTTASLVLLTAAPLLGLAQAPVIRAFNPARNATAAPRTSAVALTFSQPMAAATANGIRVFSAQSGGRKAITASANGTVLTARPQRSFRPGEVVSVSVPAAVTNTAGAAVVPAVYQFTAATVPSAAIFATGTDVTVSAGGAGAVALADVDGDGDLDLVAPGATRSVSLNDGRGNFAPTANPRLAYATAATVVMADLDNDGDLDLLTTPTPMSSNPGVYSFSNNGSGVFTAGPSLLPAGGEPTGVATGDVNGDGNLDVVMGGAYFSVPGPGAPPTDFITVYLGLGNGNFLPRYTIPLATSAGEIVLADVDNDNDLDFLVNAMYGNQLFVQLNNGMGMSSVGQTLAFDAQPAVADVDGDGDLDLLGVSYSAGTVSVNRNNGSGTFGASSAVLVGFGPGQLAVADLDGDGDPDLLTANASNGSYSLSTRLNNGSGTFTGGTDPAVSADVNYLALGDIDGDGDLDAALSSNASGTVRLQLNSGTGAALANSLPAATPAFVLTPSPAHEQVTLHLPADSRTSSLALLDALGRAVRHYPAPAGTEATLDLRGLPAGVYVLRSGSSSQRLVVE